MPRFVQVTSQVLREDEVFAAYLRKASIGAARKGGTFLGNYEVAPDSLRKYGIVLPKGGMILPDSDPEEVKAALEAEVKSRQENEDAELQRKLDGWKEAVARDILPAMRKKLVAELGTARNLRVYAGEVQNGFVYGRVIMDGLDNGPPVFGKLIEYRDGADLEKAMAALERVLPDIRRKIGDEAFLKEQAARQEAFKEGVEENAHLGVRWGMNKDRVEIPGQSPLFLFHREQGVSGGEFVATSHTPKELEERLRPLRTAEADRARNEERVDAVASRLDQESILAWTVQAEELLFRFNRKSFYWSEEGVQGFEAEANEVLHASEELKEQIRSLVKSGEQIKTREHRHQAANAWSLSFTWTHELGSLCLEGRALKFAEEVIKSK